MKFEGHGTEQGRFTHFVCRALRLYFPAEDQIAVELDTWPEFFARFTSMGKDEMENQHPVCYIGQELQCASLLSARRVVHAPNAVQIEGSKDQFVTSGGFIGMLRTLGVCNPLSHMCPQDYRRRRLFRLLLLPHTKQHLPWISEC
jgi:hypothetical protein